MSENFLNLTKFILNLTHIQINFSKKFIISVVSIDRVENTASFSLLSKNTNTNVVQKM